MCTEVPMGTYYKHVWPPRGYTPSSSKIQAASIPVATDVTGAQRLSPGIQRLVLDNQSRPRRSVAGLEAVGE